MEQKLAQLKAKLEADSSLVNKLLELESTEQVQSFLKAEGLEFTLEELDQLKDALAKSAVKGASGELSDDDLENVAGGGLLSDAFDNVYDEFADLGESMRRRRW